MRVCVHALLSQEHTFPLLPAPQAIVYWTVMMTQNAAGSYTRLSYDDMNALLKEDLQEFVALHNEITLHYQPVADAQVCWCECERACACACVRVRMYVRVYVCVSIGQCAHTVFLLPRHSLPNHTRTRTTSRVECPRRRQSQRRPSWT